MDEIKRAFDKKTAERKELRIEIQKLDKKIENNKLKRNISIICFYSVINAIIYWLCKDFDKSIYLKEVITIVLISVIFAGISFLINTVIFSQLINKGNTETKILTAMEERLSKIDAELDELRKEYDNSRN